MVIRINGRAKSPYAVDLNNRSSQYSTCTVLSKASQYIVFDECNNVSHNMLIGMK